MSTWAQFAAAASEQSEFGRRRLEGPIAYLATVRRDGSPRVHPVTPFVAGERLIVYMEPTSPKASDLRREPRFALHCGVEDNSGGQGEFLITGRAAEITDPSIREEVFERARRLGYNPRERYVVFELRIEEAMSTTYEGDSPKRTRWKSLE